MISLIILLVFYFPALWTQSLFIWSWHKREKEILYQCFSYDPYLLHHGIRFPCRYDFQFDGSTPILRWVIMVVHIFLVVNDKWFMLMIIDDYSRYLWQLCLGYRSIDLLNCLSDLSLSWDLSKLNWWNLVFSSSGGVDVFVWVWHLFLFALISGGMVFVIEKACVLVATLLNLKINVYHPYALV
jgi:hypothetical protein